MRPHAQPAWGPLEIVLAVVAAALPVYAVSWIAMPGLGPFTIVLLLLAAVVGLALLREREAVAPAARVVAREPLAWALGGFAAWAALSLALAGRGDASLQILREYLGSAVALPALTAAAFLLLRDRAMSVAWTLLAVVVAVGVAGSVLAILQMTFTAFYPAPNGELDAFVGERATGLSEHPGTWSAFALLPLAFAGAAWIRRGGRAWAAATVLIGAGIVLSSARAAWGAMAILAVLFLLAPRATTARRVSAAGLALAGVLVAVVVWDGGAWARAIAPDGDGGGGGTGGGPKVERPAPERARGGERLQVDESASLRMTLSRSELWLGAREPLTGVGLGELGPSLKRYGVPYVQGKSRDELGFTLGAPVDKHNTYAGLFAEIGAPGFLLFTAALALALLTLHRARRALGTTPEALATIDGLTAALVATAAVAVFTDADRQSFVWWLLAMALALGALSSSRAAAPARPDPAPAR